MLIVLVVRESKSVQNFLNKNLHEGMMGLLDQSDDGQVSRVLYHGSMLVHLEMSEDSSLIPCDTTRPRPVVRRIGKVASAGCLPHRRLEQPARCGGVGLARMPPVS